MPSLPGLATPVLLRLYINNPLRFLPLSHVWVSSQIIMTFRCMQLIEILALIDSEAELFSLGGNMKNRPPSVSTRLPWDY